MTRLTDEELQRLERDAVAGLYGASFAEILDALTELRERRAQDLSDNDKGALWFAVGELQKQRRAKQGSGAPHGWHNHAHAALAVLDRLLNGAKTDG